MLLAVSHHGFDGWLAAHSYLGSWLTGAATASLAIGVVFAWRSLGDARKTRHAQLLADFSLRWDSPEMRDSAALGREFGPEGLSQLSQKLYGANAQTPGSADWRTNLNDWFSAIAWPNLLETIGVMVYAKALPADLVYRLWGSTVMITWERDWRDATYCHRRDLGDDKIFGYFEWLAREMHDREQASERLARAARNRGPVGTAISAAASQIPPEGAADTQGSS